MSVNSPGDDNDFSLFREMFSDVNQNRKVYQNKKVNLKTPSEKPVIREKREKIDIHPPQDSGVLVDMTSSGSEILFARAGLQKKSLRKLKNPPGIDDDLDLHGMRSHEAESALERFLSSSYAGNLEFLLVIHGKGLRSGESGGVLKNLTISYLKHSPYVLGFSSAKPSWGGTGATCILLKRNTSI